MRPLVFHAAWAGVAFFATLAIWSAGEMVLQARTRTDRSDPSWIWMMGGSIVGMALAFAFAGAHPRLPGPRWAPLAVGLALMVAGMAFRLWAVRTLGSFFRVTVGVTDEQRVVETGPYRLLRHPSYTGMLIVYLGVGAALDSWLSVGAGTACMAVGILDRIRHEERLLRDGLPAYASYAGRTKRLVPFVW